SHTDPGAGWRILARKILEQAVAHRSVFGHVCLHDVYAQRDNIGQAAARRPHGMAYVLEGFVDLGREITHAHDGALWPPGHLAGKIDCALALSHHHLGEAGAARIKQFRWVDALMAHWLDQADSAKARLYSPLAKESRFSPAAAISGLFMAALRASTSAKYISAIK